MLFNFGWFWNPIICRKWIGHAMTENESAQKQKKVPQNAWPAGGLTTCFKKGAPLANKHTSKEGKHESQSQVSKKARKEGRNFGLTFRWAPTHLAWDATACGCTSSCDLLLACPCFIVWILFDTSVAINLPANSEQSAMPVDFHHFSQSGCSAQYQGLFDEAYMLYLQSLKNNLGHSTGPHSQHWTPSFSSRFRLGNNWDLA